MRALNLEGLEPMSKMHNPAHPGVILRGYLPEGMTVVAAAEHLGMSRKSLSAILNGRFGVTAATARKFALAFGTTEEFWMNLQVNHDLWLERKKPKPKVKKIRHAA